MVDQIGDGRLVTNTDEPTPRGTRYDLDIVSTRQTLRREHKRLGTELWKFAKLIHDQVSSLMTQYGLNPDRLPRGRGTVGRKTLQQICSDLSEDNNSELSAQTIYRAYSVYRQYLPKVTFTQEGGQIVQNYEHEFKTALLISLAKLSDEIKDDLYKKAKENNWNTATLKKEIAKLREPRIDLGNIQCHGCMWDFKAYDERFGLPGYPGRIQGQAIVNIVHAYSNPGDLVFFPFFGSGTGGDVCAGLDRRYLGIDITVPPTVAERHGQFLRQHSSLDTWPIQDNEASLVIAHPPRFLSRTHHGDTMPDLAQVDVDEYLACLGHIRNEAYRVISIGDIFCIILEHANARQDVPFPVIPFEAHRIFSERFELIQHAIVPYHPTPYSGTEIDNAIMEKRFLVDFRNVMIYMKQ